jgi:phosphatidylcholine synthase
MWLNHDKANTTIGLMKRRDTQASETRIDLSIHALTVTGILAGMASLVAVLNAEPTKAIVWMMLAVVIDGIDGPIARRWMTDSELPRFDGYILDLVIDYVTCVLVPCAFMWEFNVVNHGITGQLTIAAVLGSAALWFSQTKMETEDHWFKGFPAAWNLVIPTLWLLGERTEFNILVCLGLSVLTLSTIEFPHTIRVGRFRYVNVAVTIVWMTSLIVLSFHTDQINNAERLLLLVAPITIGTMVTMHEFETKRDAAQQTTL